MVQGKEHINLSNMAHDISEWTDSAHLQREVCTTADVENFRLLAETLPNLILTFDARGNCTYVNERWMDYTGASLQAALGKGWLAFVHEDERAQVEMVWEQALQNQGEMAVELRIRSASREYVWFKYSGNPLKQHTGHVISWVGACTNIQEQKQAAELLERRVMQRTAELERLNKDLQIARDRALEASALKSKFVANISHEIRTPMSGVLGMSELLLDCQLSKESRELAEYIHTSARALLDVVNDLLDFSRLEAGKLSISRMRMSIQQVVSVVVASTALAAQQKGIDLVVSVDADIPDVFGDATRIRQVLLNLVHNAVKFTSKGHVSIDIRVIEKKDELVVVKFTIVDTGIGISEKAKAHLFNPFEQADGSTTRRYGGTGLGLSIAKHLVSLMLGELGFDSEEGKGSSFWFWLPLETA